MANISQITLPDGNTYDIKDANAATESYVDTGLASKANTADLATVATSGDYDDLINKPTIPSAQIQSDWNEADSSAVDYIKNKPTIPAAQVNSDWNASSGVAEILNKPTIPTIPAVMPQSEATTGTATTQRTITAKVLNDTIEGKGYVTTDEKVKQTATTTDADYEVLFSATADTATRTEGARKASKLKFNPSSGNLQATQLNGVTIGSSPKFTDNNTTYTFAEGSTDGTFKVTPSGGSAQSVPVHGFQITELVDGTTTKVKSQTVDKTKSFMVEVDVVGGTNTGRALIYNSSGKIAVSDVTSTELGYLDGVTSAIQTQLGNKLSTSGGTVTGDIYRKTTNVTIGTTSNNGVTTDVSPGFVVRDSNDYYYARADGLAQTTGFVASRLVAKNKDTSGTERTNSLYAGVKKDGTRVVKLGDNDCTFIFGTNGAANLRSAINAQAALSTSTSTTGTNGFNMRKYGNVVTIQGNGIAASARGTVPSGYRPITKVYVKCLVLGTSNDWYDGCLEIATGGTITVHYINNKSNETTTSSSITVYALGSWIL